MTLEMQQKREQLKAMSRAAKQLVQAGAFDTVNEAIVAMYAEQGHTELNSFKGWLDRGFCVRRGEKALLLWGQPHKARNQEPKDGEKDEFSFFPLAYVFSQKQVEAMKQLTR